MILLVTSNIDTFNNPTILGLIQKLRKKEVEIKVVTYRNYFANPFSEVELIQIPLTHVEYANRNPIKRVWHIMESIKAHLRFLKLSVRLKPTIIIGIDSGGLVLARILQRYINVFHKQKAVLDYLSFEIFFKDEGANKNKEVEASSHIRNLIIQDSVRDNLLRKENYIADKVKSFYIPVSPLIQANQNNEKQETFLTIRERYNLKEDTKLIVSFGSFDSWTGAQWIISAVEKGLPENMVFVIHSRNKFDESNPLHQNDNLLSTSCSQNRYIRRSRESCN